MRTHFKRELYERDPKLAPLDYENRAMDLAIDALEDIAECDQAVLYVAWTHLPQTGRKEPLLYILFDGECPSLEKVPRVHLHPATGKLHPAHAILLRRQPSGVFLEGQKLKDVVRRGVEDFLRKHGVQPSRMPVAQAVAPPKGLA
jgi:hypothetical protein